MITLIVVLALLVIFVFAYLCVSDPDWSEPK